MMGIDNTNAERDSGLAQLREQIDGDSGTKNTIFHVLSNARRRRILKYLLEKSDWTATKRELSEHLAALEYGTSPDQVSSEQRRRVYIALHQTHLPKLVSSGYAEFKRGDNVIQLTERVDEVREYLAKPTRRGADWGRIYLGLGLFGLGLVVSSLVDSLPLSAVPNVVWMAIIAGTVTVAAVVHYNVAIVGRQRDDGFRARGRQLTVRSVAALATIFR